MTLADLLRLLWRARINLLLGALAGFILACLCVLLIPEKYKAVMIIAPADGYALGDYASSTTQQTDNYDRIVSLPFWRPMETDSVSTDFYRFIQTARGPSSAGILIKDDQIASELAAINEESVRNPAYLSDYLRRHIQIDPVGSTPLRKLSYLHSDPDFAAAMLRKIHLVADQMIRRDRRRAARARIDYLNNGLSRTHNPDHRRIITGLLMQQEHILMLANLDEPYAAIIVEPPASSPEPVYPDKKLLFGGLILIGLFSGYLLWGLQQK